MTSLPIQLVSNLIIVHPTVLEKITAAPQIPVQYSSPTYHSFETVSKLFFLLKNPSQRLLDTWSGFIALCSYVLRDHLIPRFQTKSL